MGLGELVIFIVIVSLFLFSASKATGGRSRRKSSDDLARLREMQEWDRISYGEDKNRGNGK